MILRGGAYIRADWDVFFRGRVLADIRTGEFRDGSSIGWFRGKPHCGPHAGVGSEIERPGEGEGEGFACGAAGFGGPGPEGVGGVLDGAAVVVEKVDEFVAVEAGEFLGAGGLRRL